MTHGEQGHIIIVGSYGDACPVNEQGSHVVPTDNVNILSIEGDTYSKNGACRKV